MKEFENLMEKQDIKLDDFKRLIGAYFNDIYDIPYDSLLCWAKLWKFENILREMVYLELRSFSTDWHKTILNFRKQKNGGKGKDKKNPYEKDKKMTHMSTPHSSPLSYYDFTNLLEFIQEENNFIKFFKNYFQPLNIFKAKSSEIQNIRNRVAHFRTLNERDPERLNHFLHELDDSFLEFCNSYIIKSDSANNKLLNEIQKNKFNFLKGYGVEVVRLDKEFIIDDVYDWTGEELPCFNIDFSTSYRPWVKKPTEDPGTITHAEFYFHPVSMLYLDDLYDELNVDDFEFEFILEKTKHVHENCIHIKIYNDSYFELTFPYYIPPDNFLETISTFADTIDNVESRGTVKKPEQIASEWPEKVLAPSHFLNIYSDYLPDTIFGEI